MKVQELNKELEKELLEKKKEYAKNKLKDLYEELERANFYLKMQKDAVKQAKENIKKFEEMDIKDIEIPKSSIGVPIFGVDAKPIEHVHCKSSIDVAINGKDLIKCRL